MHLSLLHMNKGCRGKEKEDKGNKTRTALKIITSRREQLFCSSTCYSSCPSANVEPQAKGQQNAQSLLTHQTLWSSNKAKALISTKLCTNSKVFTLHGSHSHVTLRSMPPCLEAFVKICLQLWVFIANNFIKDILNFIWKLMMTLSRDHFAQAEVGSPQLYDYHKGAILAHNIMHVKDACSPTKAMHPTQCRGICYTGPINFNPGTLGSTIYNSLSIYSSWGMSTFHDRIKGGSGWEEERKCEDG